jgi:phosphoglycolate phosphatase-like HAD superfamily hydrolase
LKCHGAGKRSLENAAVEIFGTSGLMDQVNFQGKTDPLILYESLAPAGISEQEVNRKLGPLKEAYLAFLEKNIREAEVTLLPGVLPLLEELKRREGIILGLLTGNFSEGARIKLSVFDLNRYFVFGVYGDDSHIRNEMPGIAREKIRGLFDTEIDFRDMVVIGDTVYDIECGRNAGAVTIAVGTGWTGEDELLAREPDYYFRDLSDTGGVTGAIYEALDFTPSR